MLNMTRTDVQEYVFGFIDKLLSEHNIKYIKWDMNRPFSETGAKNLACPKMLYYLHTKAVYDIVDRLKKNIVMFSLKPVHRAAAEQIWVRFPI